MPAPAWREALTMKQLATCGFAVVAGLAVAFAFTHVTSPAVGQSGPGWTSLFDGKVLGEWDRVGEANWRVEDGAIVADKLTSKDPAYLVTKNKYKDFEISAEFWASDDANSGIFI